MRRNRLSAVFSRGLSLRSRAGIGAVVLGLLVFGLLVLVAADLRSSGEADAALETQLVSDCDGAITDWFLGLPDGDAPFFEETQAALVEHADPAIRFHVYYARPQRRAAFEAALSRRGVRAHARIHWHAAPLGVWPWTRDLFLAATTTAGDPVTLLHHPAQYGRRNTGWDTGALRMYGDCVPGRRTLDTQARIDGGAVVVDGENVFANRDFVDESLRCGDFKTAPEALSRLGKPWGRPIHLLRVGDLHRSGHCDLVMMPAGRRRMVMSSPALGAALLERLPAGERAAFTREFFGTARLVPGRLAPGAERFDVLRAMQERSQRPAIQEPFLRLRGEIERLGYTCVLVPHLGLTPPEGGMDVTFSYANVIIDERDAQRTVFLPTYRLPTLDNHAADAWRSLGYRVVPIDSLGPALNGGALHCLSQVFKRSGPALPRR